MEPAPGGMAKAPVGPGADGTGGPGGTGGDPNGTGADSRYGQQNGGGTVNTLKVVAGPEDRTIPMAHPAAARRQTTRTADSTPPMDKTEPMASTARQWSDPMVHRGRSVGRTIVPPEARRRGPKTPVAARLALGSTTSGHSRLGRRAARRADAREQFRSGLQFRRLGLVRSVRFLRRQLHVIQRDVGRRSVEPQCSAGQARPQHGQDPRA